MWEVLESRPCKRQLKRAPKEVVKQYEAWKEVVQASGLRALQLIPGYRDHALKGEWKGARSSYLTKKWRVLYVVEGDRFEVLVLEVNPMTTKRGKKVQEALRGERFTKSVVRVKLSPAEMVRLLREKNELTQSELAERTGLTQSTISNLENGRTQLGAERAKTLARALRVHPAVLLFPGWDVAKESAA